MKCVYQMFKNNIVFIFRWRVQYIKQRDTVMLLYNIILQMAGVKGLAYNEV